MLNKCNFDGVTFFYPIEGWGYDIKSKWRTKGRKWGHWLMKALANRWMGRLYTPQALPRHPPPCQVEQTANLHILWIGRGVVGNLYLHRQYLHPQLLLCTCCQVRRWVHPTITPQATMVKLIYRKIARVEFSGTRNYGLTLEFDSGEVLWRPNSLAESAN